MSKEEDECDKGGSELLNLSVSPFFIFFTSGTSAEEGVGICHAVCEHLLKTKVSIFISLLSFYITFKYY